MTALPSFPFPAGPASEPPAEYARQARLGRVRLASGREALLVTRYRDVKQVLADPRFSRAAYKEGPLWARSAESLPLVTTDDPVHSGRRSTVTHAFTARAVRRLRPMVAELAKEQLAGLTAPADLVGEFTVPFALRVMCRILGLPEEDLPRFKAWGDRMMSIDRYPPPEVTRAQTEFHEYFAALVGSVEASIHSGRRPEGLIADVLDPRRPDRKLTRTETITLAAGILVAGYETTSNIMATVVYHLLSRPELVSSAVSSSSLDAAIEEILRYMCVNGTGGAPHVATEDVPLSDGVVVPAGSVVVPLADAANNDPAVFDSPRCLRPDREPNPHLGFGYGPHYCLGAELARLEMRVGIAALLAEFPSLRIAVPVTDLRWRTDMVVRGLWELPVTWEER